MTLRNLGSNTTVLSTTFASSGAGVAGFTPPVFSALSPVTTIPVGVLADGLLYGYTGNTLQSSTDQGATWTTIRTDLPAGTGEFITVKDTSGGEVLFVFGSMIYRTTGWASNKVTATLTGVRAANGVASFYEWGVDTNPATGLCVATNYQGTLPYDDARYAWKSTDGGLTWTTIFDLVDHAAEVSGGTNSNCHPHHCIIDPWANDRIWLTWHRATVLGSGHILYSDDGGTTWTTFVIGHQPTAAVACKGGLLFSTDEQPNGAYVVQRTTDPADMEYRLAVRWPAPATGVAGFGQWATRSADGDRAYIGYIGDVGFQPIIVQSDGVGASIAYTSPTAVTSVLGDGFRGIHCQGNKIIAAYRDTGAWSTMTARATKSRTPVVDPVVGDPGWALGGSSWGIRSVALGRSTTLAARTVAAGDAASVTSTDSVAVGDTASVTGASGTAVGGAASSEGRGVAIGAGATARLDGMAIGNAATNAASTSSSTAIGANAATTGSNSTAVGRNAASQANSVALGSGATANGSAVAIGQGANTTADFAVVIGHTAVGGGAYGTIVGETATVLGTTQHATALGRGATVGSGHTRSVALGDATTTTLSDQTALGPRHIEIGAVTAPGTPAASTARLYIVDDGLGHMRLAVKLPSGGERALWTETMGPCLKSGGGTLASGQLVVADTAITANSIIKTMISTPAGTPGATYIKSKTAGTGFTIGSSGGSADTSVVRYEIESY